MVQSQFDITPEVAPAVSEAAASAIPDDLLAEAGALAAKLTEWRHELHRFPSFQTTRRRRAHTFKRASPSWAFPSARSWTATAWWALWA